MNAVACDNLPNGVTLLRCAAPPTRLAAVTLTVPLPGGQSPVAHLLADLWRWTAGIGDRLAGVGARAEPVVTPDCVGLRLEVPAPGLRQLCALLPELAVVELPPAAALGRMRRTCAARLAGARGTRGPALDLLRGALFGAAHPYGVGADERVARVLSCHDEALRQCVDQLNATAPTVAVCGGGNVAQLAARLAAGFATRTFRASPPPPQAVRRCAVHKPGPRHGSVDGQRACFLIGTPGVGLGAPDKPALHVAWAVLGGRDGLLDQRLRRERSLTYSLAAFSREFTSGGYCACVVDCDPAAVGEVAATVVAALSDVAYGRFAEIELDRARLRLTVAHHLAQQSCREVATRACCYATAGVPTGLIADYPRLVGAVGAADVRRVAAEFFDRHDAVEIVLRPRLATE